MNELDLGLDIVIPHVHVILFKCHSKCSYQTKEELVFISNYLSDFMHV